MILVCTVNKRNIVPLNKSSAMLYKSVRALLCSSGILCFVVVIDLHLMNLDMQHFCTILRCLYIAIYGIFLLLNSTFYCIVHYSAYCEKIGSSCC